MRRQAILVTVGLVLGASRADADNCVDPKWGGPTGNRQLIDVWLNTTPTQGVAQVLGLDAGAVDDGVRRAVSIWHEESGAAIVLRYRGPTSSSSISGAIVVRAHAECGAGLMESFPTGNNGTMNHAEIVAYRKWPGSPCGAVIAWQLPAEDDGWPFTAIVLHELGHAMGFYHPGDASRPQCVDFGQVAVMRGGGVNNAQRVPRLWDKHRLLRAYQPRSQFSLTTWRTWNPGTASWSVAASAAREHLHRPGSLTQNFLWTLLGTYGGAWFSSDRGFRKELFFSSDSTFNYYGALPTSPSPRVAQEGPVAVAIEPSSSRAIAVFPQKAYSQPWYMAGEDMNWMCYRLSTDGGVTFGAATCLVAGSQRYGFTAAYDPRSARFLVAYARDVDHRLYVMTIPTTGGTATGSLLTNTSWHGPSIACRNATMGCRIAYEDKMTGSLAWLEAEVNLATGSITPGATRWQSWKLYDSPSIVWFEQDQTYRLAFRQGAGAAYARSMTATGISWTGMPDIWNSSTGRISSPVLATERSCFFGCTGNLRAWFLQWW